MSLTDTIMEQAGDAVVGQVAKKLGLGDDLAKKAVSSLLPQFLSGIVSKARGDAQWAGTFGEVLQSKVHEKYLDEPETLADDAAIDDGNKILGHVLEEKEVSREVAKKTAEETGIDLGVAKKALPMVAGLAMGALSKQGGAAAILGDIDVDDVKGILGKLF